jgi:F-type H+-transporting ATPase subunit b
MQRFHPRGSPTPWLLGGALGAVALTGYTLVTSHADGGSGGTLGALVFALNFFNPYFWAELATHILAFVIFILILRKFAFRPLIKVIDERRDKIAADFQKAEDLAQEAEESKKRYETQIAEIEAKAREKMHEAIEEGKRIAAEIQQKAREDAEKLLERAQKNAEIELANARKQLRKDVVELTLAATEKVLREQVDRAAHTRHIEKFIDEVGGLQ